MFSNKHVVIALLVAPVLSILAWFAVGNLLGEQPRAAIVGQDYQLLEKSNCRYSSGECDLVNGDVKIALQINQSALPSQLELTSSIALRGVLMAIVPVGGEDTDPVAMTLSDDIGQRWRLPLQADLAEGERLHLVAVTDNNRFSADVSTAFSRSEP